MRPLASQIARLIFVPLLMAGCSEDEQSSSTRPVPDSDQFVFVSARDGNPEIYTVNIDGTGITRLTHNVAIEEFPSWSPDGQHIAFQSNRSGTFEIYVMNVDGSNVVQRTFAGGYSEHPTWSPDGTTIAYSTLSDGSSNIWKVGAFAGSPSLFFSKPGLDWQPDWSPSGARLALSSDWYAYDTVTDIFIVKVDGSEFTGLTGDIFDQIDYMQPAWSPDELRLSLAISYSEATAQLALINPDGSGLTPIAFADTKTRSSWSPDGQRIAYTSPTKDIVWIKADGSASGTVTTNGWNADWRP